MVNSSNSQIFKERRIWMRAIARRLDFHSSIKVVAFVISEFCNPKTGEAYASVGTIAEASGLSERTTSRAIRQLVLEGLLCKLPPRRGRQTNTYCMLITQAEKVVELTKNKARKLKRATTKSSVDQNYAGRYQDWQMNIAKELGGPVEGFTILQRLTDVELREAYHQSLLKDQSIRGVASHIARLATKRREPDEDLGPF